MDIIRMLRPLVGLAVVAHAWAHTVLPLRGLFAPETLAENFMPLICYGIALLGFSAAGVGILGVWPFTRAYRQLLVIAAAYSLVSLEILGHGNLWWGGMIDVVLLIVGVSGILDRLPAPAPTTGGVRRALRTATAVAFLAYTGTAVMWPVYRTWGSTAAEYALALPGDDSGRRAALEIQRAVTVNAPARAVWPWLVQLGQDRAGFYSYDWLERAFGVDVHNVTEIRPEWQQRAVGDLVRATQPGYLGGLFASPLGWSVEAIVPERALVLEHWGTFALVSDGATTRFIIRTPIGHENTPVWAAVLDMATFQLPHFIMERRMMLRIKTLAESSARIS
jgi:hypothetical protein